MAAPGDADAIRRTCYQVMAVTVIAVAIARIFAAENLVEPSRYTPPTKTAFSSYPPDPPREWPEDRPEPTPMFSSNDKSRWATIRALVNDGTYVIGKREHYRETSGDFGDTGIVFEEQYRSIDKVMDPETGLFYSSKPPLFPTVLAGEYLLLKRILGWDIVKHRWYVICTMLITVNVLPFIFYLMFLSRLIEEHGTSDFGRILTFAVACFGTFVTTFMGTLNNHNPGTMCVLFAVYPLLRKETAGLFGLVVSGFFAGLAATFEFPAMALLVGLFVYLLVTRPRDALLCFLPAAIIPIAALLLTNFLAMGKVLPAYLEFGGPWYNYPGSHWAKAGTSAAKGIDFADETKEMYAFHLLTGHHGWFSLTPIWLLALGGMVAAVVKAGPEITTLLSRFGKTARSLSPAVFAALTLAVSAAVIGFYIYKTNNYGGFTSGPRWLFWLTPLWLMGLLPIADWAGRRWSTRWLALVLFGVSCFSVFYPAVNPWRAPWILQLLETENWLRY